MKAELLDVDAHLSHVTAQLSLDPPDVVAALASLEIARDKILAFAETLESSTPQNAADN